MPTNRTTGGTDARHDPHSVPASGTYDQLRAEIDAGRTGDKNAHSDPSAAPLGTDAEAGGATTPREAIAKARLTEIRRKGKPEA